MTWSVLCLDNLDRIQRMGDALALDRTRRHSRRLVAEPSNERPARRRPGDSGRVRSVRLRAVPNDLRLVSFSGPGG